MECLSSGAMFGSFKDSFGYSNLNSSHLSKIDLKSGLFDGIVLSYWDNILGPRLGHLWLQCEEKCTENSVKYVVTHTLNGELTRQAPPNAVDTKFFIIKERGLVFSSYIFTGISKGAGETLYSLSLLLPFSALKEYMQYQELVDVRMKLLVARLRVLQEKDLLTSIPNFSKCLLSLIDMVSSLHLHGLSSTFSVWDSAFAPGNSSCFSSAFLEKCITSHLETFGSTVVVGKAVEPINLMINTLALFVSPEERCQSRYVTNDKNMQYDPDLFVQGILTNEDDSYQLSPKKILTSRFPTTLINLEKETVSQSSLFAEHCSTRHQFLNLELQCLWNDDEDAPIYPSLGMMHDLKHESKMISDMLNDIQLLPAQDSIRLAYIENFKRLIKRKAVAVIRYIEDLSRFGYERMDSSRLQEVRTQLRLAKDGDFLIVLATAEKLRPNIYMCAMGEGGQNGTEAIYKTVLGCL